MFQSKKRLFQQEDEDLWRSVWSQSRPAPRRSGNGRKFGHEAFSASFLSKQPFGQVHGGRQDKKTQEPASEWSRFWSLEPGCQLRLRPDWLFIALHVKIRDGFPSCSMIRILFIHWLGYSGELIPCCLRSKSIVELFLQCSCLFGGNRRVLHCFFPFSFLSAAEKCEYFHHFPPWQLLVAESQDWSRCSVK